jgi:PIN like domain
VSRTYFTDRDLGKQFPAILTEAGLRVERHADLFSPEGSDEQWLEHCGRNGHIAISHNSRIRYVPNELAAVKRFKVALIILVGKAPTAELARNFVNTLGRIEDFVASHTAPFIAKVYRPTTTDSASAVDTPGRIELWYPKR